jgi:hypothetical protein
MSAPTDLSRLRLGTAPDSWGGACGLGPVRGRLCTS